MKTAPQFLPKAALQWGYTNAGLQIPTAITLLDIELGCDYS